MIPTPTHHGYALKPLEVCHEASVIALGEEADMGTLSDLSHTTVALNDDKEVVGFLRLNFYHDIAYVNPVVVAPAWQKQGIGHALMEHALKEHHELRFVSRGTSLAFYEEIGCYHIPWDHIAPEIVADCDSCELLEQCHPQPCGMKKER